MKALTAMLFVVFSAFQILAQPVCPPVNFEELAQVKIQNRAQKIVSGLLRQPDQSFSQYEITGNVATQTASKVGVIPDIQTTFFTCSAVAARTPKPGAAPNISVDPLGVAPQNTIVTDLVGDGVGSIVGFDQEGAPGQVVVVAANPDYTVHFGGTYPVGPVPVGVLAGDFNGDGKHDVAAVYFGPLDNSAPGGISLFLGNGTGSLQPAGNFAAGLNVTGAAVWDFNGDGKDDLAVVNNGDGTVAIFLGTANGTLTPGNTYSLGPQSYPTSVAVADVNGDGTADLVVMAGQNLVTLFGKGGGEFQTGGSTPLSISQSFIATGDFNEDGKTDVAVIDFFNGLLHVLLGNGDGTFTESAAYLTEYALGTYGNLATFYVEDFDGDGNLDFVFASGHPDALITLPYLQTVGVMFGNGDGTFNGAPAYTVAAKQPTSIVTADFNGDGKPDLALGGQSGQVSILLGSGGGRFKAGANLTLAVATSSTAVAEGDVNGDGKADLAINDGNSGAAVFLGNGDGTFQTPVLVASGGSGTSSVSLGDFNNDHKLDLAIANGSSNTVTVAPGNGDGTFGNGATVPVGSNPTMILAGDFNVDGNLDLAVVNTGSITSAGDPGGLSILLGEGNGEFRTAVSYSSGTNPNSISMGDFNHDGIPDLVLSSQNGFNYALVVFIGNGDGTFKPGVFLPTDFGPGGVAVGDFSGDGKQDLVVPHCCGDTDITYFLGNGDGTFQNEVYITLGNATASVVADFNGDKKPDIAFAGQAGPAGNATIFLNIHSTAQQTATVVSSANPSAAAIAPNSLATAYGMDLATDNAGGTSVPLPVRFGGTSVSIQDSAKNTTAAPLLYVSPTQVNFEVPVGVADGAGQVTVTGGDGTESVASVQIARVAPGLFELNSSGLAAADVVVYHADGTQTFEQVYTVNSAGQVISSPVNLGSATDKAFLSLYGTGFQAAGTAGVKVSINGSNVPVQFAGPQGGFVGLDQANVQLSASLAVAGTVTIQLSANGIAANAVNITVQ